MTDVMVNYFRATLALLDHPLALLVLVGVSLCVSGLVVGVWLLVGRLIANAGRDLSRLNRLKGKPPLVETFGWLDKPPGLVKCKVCGDEYHRSWGGICPNCSGAD